MKRKEKNPKKEQKQEQFCDVCKFKIIPGQSFEKLQCSGCLLIVHKFCYAPDFKQSKSIKFKCDLCKKRSSKGKSKDDKIDCSFCGIQKGILKEISNGQWMHVVCALTSPRVTLLDYQSLRFSSESNPVVKKGTKQKCGYPYCQKTTFTQLCIVKDCKQRRHLNCLLHENTQFPKQQTILLVNKLGLLDRNQGSLIFKLKKQQKIFSALTLIQDEGREPHYFVCRSHNDSLNFIWCYCGKELSDVENQIQCQNCQRWYHDYDKCKSDYIPDKKVCKGCKDDNIYIKNMSLPELISEAIKVQTRQSWDKTHLKFLDHFALKYSIQIQKKLKEQMNKLTIQRYFLRKELDNLDKQVDDEINQGRKLEILFYLFKREIKNQSQITVQDIQQMLGDITYSSDKLNLKWSQEKPQKLHKNFLQNKLKKLKKDDFREIKTRLNKLEKQLNNNKKTEKQIVLQLFPALKILSNSQIWLSAFKKIKESSLNYQILEFLVGLQLSKSQLQDILCSFKILIRARNNKFIDENDYLIITFKIYPVLNQQKIKDLKKIHMKLLKGVHQRKLYEKKRQIVSIIQDKYEQENNSYQKEVLRNKAISNGMLFPNHFNVFKYQAESLEFQISKKIFLKKYQTLNFSELGQALQSLRLLLNTNSRLGLMEEQQRKFFQALQYKYKFYNAVFLYINQLRKKLAYNNIQMGVLQQAYSSQSQNKEINGLRTYQRLQKELYCILNDWPLNPESILLGLMNLYQVCKQQASFTQHQQEILITFFDKLLLEINKIFNQGLMIMKPPLLKQIVIVAKYFKIQEKCEFYTRIVDNYNQWKLKLEQNFIDIEKVLECPERTKDLINVIDQKISQVAYHNTYLDFSSEIRKLKNMRTWAIFSQKMLVAQKKPTLTAIQNARCLMDKIFYPKNSVRAQIQKLDLQSKTLNKKIGRFLQRQKFSDMDYQQELKFLQTKMTLKEAHALQKDLQNSELDVEIQLNQLKEQLSNSKYFPTNIVNFCQQAKKSQTLADLRKKVLEGPFLVCSLQEYQILFRALYSRKCKQFSGKTTKKQYFRMLNYGGLSSYQLYNKTQSLFKMYKEIQTAQAQVIKSKPNSQFLINHDIKKISIDLQEDSVEFSRVEKYYNLANKYKQRFSILREERADIQKYNALQFDLNKLPINCRDITNEINRMRRELQDFSNRVKVYLNDQNQIIRLQFCSPFCTQLLNKYQRCGIKNEIMNKFENIVTKARQISEIFNNLSLMNYKTFSLLCTSSTQLEKNDQIYDKRKNAFQQIYQNYIQNPQPLIEVGLTLLAEGGFLIKRPIITQDAFAKLVDVRHKLLKCERKIQPQVMKNQDGEENVNSQNQDLQNSDQEGYDKENLESQNQEDDSNNIQNIELDQVQEGYSSVSDSEEELEQNASKEKQKSKKRPRPIQYVISDNSEG